MTHYDLIIIQSSALCKKTVLQKETSFKINKKFTIIPQQGVIKKSLFSILFQLY